MKRQSISLYKKGFLLCLAVFISLGACACAHRMENEGWDYNAKRGPTPLVIGGQEPSNGASQDFSPNTYVPYVGGKIKFTYSAAMAAESIHAAESYIQAFTAAYPEVTVTTDSVAANIDAQISAGTIGDVFLFPDEDIYKYAKTYQCLMDLTPYFSVYKVDTDDIYPGLTEAAVLNGSFCYVPAFYAQTALLCNLTVLKELGLADKISSRLTWNEFTDMVRQTAFSPEGEATYRRTKIDLTDDVNFTAFIEAYTGHTDWCGGAYQQIRFFDENALTLSALRDAVELAQEGFMYITGGENTLTITPSDHYKTEADMAQAQALKKEYEEKLKNIESERTAILQEARTTALKNSQIIISDAKTEATAIKDRANLEIERAEEKAKDDIKKQIVQVSTLMSEKFVAAKMTEDEQNKLVDETISDLEEIEWIG